MTKLNGENLKTVCDKYNYNPENLYGILESSDPLSFLGGLSDDSDEYIILKELVTDIDNAIEFAASIDNLVSRIYDATEDAMSINEEE